LRHLQHSISVDSISLLWPSMDFCSVI